LTVIPVPRLSFPPCTIRSRVKTPAGIQLLL
jgi:hypothetical protein